MYYITATVNLGGNTEYDYTIPKEDSLDAAMKRLLAQHPNATSVILYIVPGGDDMPGKFKAI